MVPNSMEAHTVETARARDRDRWLAAHLAPSDTREPLLALYAFHVEIAKTRDVVSEPMAGRIRLQWWREAVEDAALGAPHRHPVVEALAVAFAANRLFAPDLLRLVDARENDLADDGFATERDFLGYIEDTTGALNRAALGALGVADTVTVEASDHVARAYGIAGHMRATAAAATHGRVLLPLDLLREHGVTAAALRAGHPEEGLRAVAQTLSERAQAELAAARVLRRETVRAALPVLALARFADTYLRRIAVSGYDLFSGSIAPAPVAGPLNVLRTMVTGRY